MASYTHMYQNFRNYGRIVYDGSCRICIINPLKKVIELPSRALGLIEGRLRACPL